MIDRAVDEYRGARTPLSSWLESEIPKALAALRHMMDRLEDYVAQGSGEQGAGSSEQGAGGHHVPMVGEQGAGSTEHGAWCAFPAPNDAGGAPTLQADAAPVLLPAPRSPLPAPSSPLPAPPPGGPS
jgi:hypothetical protein